jgi:hypothetical protein
MNFQTNHTMELQYCKALEAFTCMRIIAAVLFQLMIRRRQHLAAVTRLRSSISVTPATVSRTKCTQCIMHAVQTADWRQRS